VELKARVRSTDTGNTHSTLHTAITPDELVYEMTQITNSLLSYKPCRQCKPEENGTNLDLWIHQRWIRCLGGVSIPCRPVTPIVSPIFSSGEIVRIIIKISVSRTVNNWLKPHLKAFDLKQGCIDKLDCFNDRKICGKLFASETVETPMTSICH
jgi:hypothetical protein